MQTRARHAPSKIRTPNGWKPCCKLPFFAIAKSNKTSGSSALAISASVAASRRSRLLLPTTSSLNNVEIYVNRNETARSLSALLLAHYSGALSAMRFWCPFTRGIFHIHASNLLHIKSRFKSPLLNLLNEMFFLPYLSVLFCAVLFCAVLLRNERSVLYFELIVSPSSLFQRCKRGTLGTYPRSHLFIFSLSCFVLYIAILPYPPLFFSSHVESCLAATGDRRSYRGWSSRYPRTGCWSPTMVLNLSSFRKATNWYPMNKLMMILARTGACCSGCARQALSSGLSVSWAYCFSWKVAARR